MKKQILLTCAVFSSLLTAPLHADPSDPIDPNFSQPVISAPTDPSEAKWSVELGSGILFSNIRDSSVDDQTSVPIQLTLSRKITDIKIEENLGGVFRGYGEFFARSQNMIVTEGLESYIIGAEFGPRWNFVQEGWQLVPFFEVNVGFAWTDSNPQVLADGRQRGFGQDFNFMFGAAAGVRYDINEQWFARVSVVYKHVSNAGLSKPEFQNESFDGIGPVLSFGYRF